MFACSGKPSTGEAGDAVGRAVELQAGAGGGRRPKHLQLHIQGGKSSLVAGPSWSWMVATMIMTGQTQEVNPSLLQLLSVSCWEAERIFILCVFGKFCLSLLRLQLCVLFNRLIGRRLVPGVYFQGSLAVIPFTFVIAPCLQQASISYHIIHFHFWIVNWLRLAGIHMLSVAPFYGAHVLVHFVPTPSLDSISLG